MKRCSWCNLNNPKYVEYHDKEWGRKKTNDNELLEMLILEIFQAGLSWECILNKREYFRKDFDNFDYLKISKYDEEKVNSLMNDKNIVRNRRKIVASINNTKVFMNIQKEFGTFSKYIWQFENMPKNDLANEVAKDLQKRGMVFVGRTIIYSYLQAIGMINDHEKECYLYKKGS